MVKSAKEGGDDEAVASRTRVLMRVSDSTGKLAMTEVGHASLPCCHEEPPHPMVPPTLAALFQ